MAHVVYWNLQSNKVKRQDLTTSLDADRPKKLGGRVKADPVSTTNQENEKMSRKLPMIGVMINTIAIAACVVVFLYTQHMGKLSLPPEDHNMMINKIKSTNDLEKLQKFSLEAQELRVSASKVLDNQMEVQKELLGYALLFSCLNAGCFFMINRRTKGAEC